MSLTFRVNFTPSGGIPLWIDHTKIVALHLSTFNDGDPANNYTDIYVAGVATPFTVFPGPVNIRQRLHEVDNKTRSVPIVLVPS